MASSGHFEIRLATVAFILCFLLGMIFPFGSTCTGEFNSIAVNSGGLNVYYSVCI